MHTFLATLAAALVSTAAFATPIELVTNGDFNSTATHSYQINGGPATSGLAGWTTSSDIYKYNYLLLPSDATVSNPISADGHTIDDRRLAPAFPGASPNGGAFVGLDADTDYNAALTQTVNGLISGDKYTVSFYWAGTQNRYHPGPTMSSIDVSFGGATQSTGFVSVPTLGFIGWNSAEFTFTADGASNLLSFLAVGTPHGNPPFALLDGVSVQAVATPEPGAIALLGLSGLGLLAVARRRK